MEAGPIFIISGGDSHSGPHACVTSTLVTKPLPATHLLFKNNHIAHIARIPIACWPLIACVYPALS